MQKGSPIRILLAFALTLCCVGCGEGEDLSGNAFPIENGYASAAFPASGALVYNREKVVCTASLVAPDRILSAGHCFMGATAEKIKKVEFVIGYDWKTAVVRAPLDHVITHPGFDNSKWPYAHDIAVGVLAQSITKVKPAMLYTADARTLVGKDVTLVGCGRSANQDDIGLRRQTCVTVSDILDYDWRYKFEGTGACNGDSGGPAYAKLDGVWRQVGVTSGGEGDGCRVNGLYTRLDIHADWLEQQGVPTQTIRDVICSEKADGQCDGLCEIDRDCEEMMCGAQCPPLQSAPPADNTNNGSSNPPMPSGITGLAMQFVKQLCPLCTSSSTPNPAPSSSCPAEWDVDPTTGQCLPPCPTGWVRDAQGFCQFDTSNSSACPPGWVEDGYGYCQPECRYVTRDVIGQECIYSDQFSGKQCFSYPISCDSVSCRCPY